MADAETARFTVGVFQDVAWAAKGLDALKDAGFPPESLTIVSKESPETGALIERVLGSSAEHLNLAAVGTVVARATPERAAGGSGRSREAGAGGYHATSRVPAA
jgi:hypothetical protein